jgi:hypothetical protein
MQNWISCNFSFFLFPAIFLFFISGRGMYTCGDFVVRSFGSFDLLVISSFWLSLFCPCRSFVCRSFVCRSFVCRSFVCRSFVLFQFSTFCLSTFCRSIFCWSIFCRGTVNYVCYFRVKYVQNVGTKIYRKSSKWSFVKPTPAVQCNHSIQ